MEPISTPQLDACLSGAGIAVADPSLHIGRELSYTEPALRTVVIHLDESDTQIYVSKVISIILELEKEWFLIPRYGTASDLHLIESRRFAAILFRSPDRQKLVEYLCTRPMDIGGFSADLYVLSTSGKVLLTWDHHTAREGLAIQLCKVSQTTQLLVGLNELGAELEVYDVNR
ncbi:MAG TPA: hypothetical protein VMV04_01555 [Thermodesulfobacteriota bacterium]|nr:hypothetical protein [Thermodesulfobacteriota bacterium]